MRSAAEILQDLKRKIYYPVYFLSGEEPFYIDQISDFIEENILSAEEKEFNQTILYGKETDVLSIVDACKRFPMMSNYQVIIVKEAQTIKNIEELASYIENPLNTTILIICFKYGKLDKRKSFTKLVEKKTLFYESPKVYDNQVPGWITSYFKEHGYAIQQKAALMMAEFLGTDLGKIVNEAGKLMINVPQETEINASHVEVNIGISKDFNVFELQKALGAKNVFKANQIIQYFAENEKENPIIKVLPMLFTYFQKVFLYHRTLDKSPNNLASVLSINRAFIEDYTVAARNYPVQKIKRIFSLLREYDLRSKGVNTAPIPDGELMKELVYKIIH